MKSTIQTLSIYTRTLASSAIALAFFIALSAPALAASPDSGTLGPDLGSQLDWVGTSPGGVNPGPQLQDHDSFCEDGVNCEYYELQLTGSPGDWQGIQVRLQFNWIALANDYDIFVHAGTPDGPVLTDGATGPSNFERFVIDPDIHGTGTFYLHVVYFAATAADQYDAVATVVAKSAGPVPAPIAAGIPPRYQVHAPSEEQIAAGMTRNTQDEPNIGVNWDSGNVILQALLQTLKVDFDDLSCPQTPSSTWEDISPPTAATSFDPILFTDHQTHRTFVHHLILNPLANISAYTDDDGETWIPSQGAGAGSGIDHQTIGGGPFAAPVPAGAVYPNSVYYCAQDIAFANCALSLDGGTTYGPAVPMYTLNDCAGLHGHVKVGPQGTAYVPNAECFGEINPNENAVAVSEDNGLTWDIRTVPGTVGAGGSDPSVAIADDGTVYLGFVDDDKFPAVAVSHDRGHTWTNVYDVGAMVGVQNATFPAMVAGDPDRAAMAFYGTAESGDANQFFSEGEWYLYVAHTYDGGQSWITVNATPDDPLQRGGIHLGGGGSVHRNLLDFFDADYDPEGRMVVGFADGCIGSCVAAPEGARGNSYVAYGTIARQTGGRRLIAAHDPVEPTVPGAPRLTAARNGATTTLAISVSEDGASPITDLEVYRAAEGEAEELLAVLDGAESVFIDPQADPGQTYSYRVTAVNALGASCGTNTVTAAPLGSSCDETGMRVVTDLVGDNDTAPLDPDMDIEWISLGEPYFENGEQKLVFTMKVGSLDLVPPERMWRILWDYPDAPKAPAPTSPAFAGTYFIGMDSDTSGEVSFSYGLVEDLSAVVLGVAPPEVLGTADAESGFDADGTIRFVISTDRIGGPGAGDLIGGLVGRTYPLRQDQTLRSTGASDSAGVADTYQLVGNAACEIAPPETECFEDDDPGIAYGTGWHRVSHPDASDGSFMVKPGQSPNGNLLFDFEVAAGQTGALQYHFARSSKGGSADVYIDGEYRESIDFNGGSGKLQNPDFGFSASYAGLEPGTHEFELRNVNGAVYVDQLCLESAWSETQAASGPGQSAITSGTLGVVSNLVYTLAAPTGTEAISVVASAPSASNFVLLLVDPGGLTLESVVSNNGIAVIEKNVSASGTYQVKVLNQSLSPTPVWTAATPQVRR